MGTADAPLVRAFVFGDYDDCGVWLMFSKTFQEGRTGLFPDLSVYEHGVIRGTSHEIFGVCCVPGSVNVEVTLVVKQLSDVAELFHPFA